MTKMPLRARKIYHMQPDQYQRFPEQQHCIYRSLYDPNFQHFHKTLRTGMVAKTHANEPGFSHIDLALAGASWTINKHMPFAYEWNPITSPQDYFPPELQSKAVDANDSQKMSKIVKRAALFFGASLTGIAKIDLAWLYKTKVNLYSTAIQEKQGTHFEEMELSPNITNAIVMAVEMDADGIANAPNYLQFAAAGLGYSKMSVYIAMMAQFIRNLGYKAIPCANDTGLSIPLAIDAGLGALGRNGLLITRKYGPRVRLCKVLTDLPLACDEPDEEFIAELTETCKGCRKCADACAVKAISQSDDPDYTTHSLSNNPGLKKWYVDVEKCYGEWVNVTTDCGKCIQACPFSQIPTKGSPSTFWK